MHLSSTPNPTKRDVGMHMWRNWPAQKCRQKRTSPWFENEKMPFILVVDECWAKGTPPCHLFLHEFDSDNHKVKLKPPTIPSNGKIWQHSKSLWRHKHHYWTFGDAFTLGIASRCTLLGVDVESRLRLVQCFWSSLIYLCCPIVSLDLVYRLQVFYGFLISVPLIESPFRTKKWLVLTRGHNPKRRSQWWVSWTYFGDDRRFFPA